MAYRAKTGPLDAGSKVEAHLASVQALIVQALGGKAKPGDFLMRAESEQPQTAQSEGIDMNQAMAAFEAMGAIDGGR